MTVRVALAGFGLAGRVFHAPLIAATEGLELASVVSSDPARVHAALPGVPVAASLDAALRDPGIELVVVATPDHLHEEHALAALDAGKHVVVDKPLAPTLAAGRAIAARAAQRGRMLMVFHNRRWDADFLTLRRLLAEDALGDILQFESHFDRFRPAASGTWKDGRPAGVWQDLGPHLVDQALQLLGMPIAVSADLAIQSPNGTMADYAHVVLRYERARAILHCSRSIAASGLRFAVHGTRGSFVKHGLDPQESQSQAGLRPGDPQWGLDPDPAILTRIEDGAVQPAEPLPCDRGNYAAFYAGLRDALSGAGPNPVPPEQALATMTVLEAALASARERREVAV